MTDTQQFWSGEGGEKYHARNRVKWWERRKIWAGILSATSARSVFEGGCGAGFNLTAIKAEQPQVEVHGCDLNEVAIRQAWAAGLSNVRQDSIVDALSLYGMGSAVPLYELCMTVGVLIHVPPEALESTMRLMIDASAQYVLSIEYHAEQEEAIVYRGQEGLLWRRNYGGLYQDLGLKPVFSGTVGPADGFDNCNWALLSK